MIERNVGDDAQARLHHVGGIQTPTHADLEHNHVGRVAREIFKGHRGQRLKEAGMPGQIAFPNQPLGGAVDHIVEQREIVVADGLAIEANPLIDANQMRRSVEPRLQPGRLQDGCQRCSGRTLAVGTSDQHGWKTIFRMSQRRQQHAHVCQIELVRRRLRQLVAQRVHLRDCGFVGQGQLSAVSFQLSARRYQFQSLFSGYPENHTQGSNHAPSRD